MESVQTLLNRELLFKECLWTWDQISSRCQIKINSVFLQLHREKSRKERWGGGSKKKKERRRRREREHSRSFHPFCLRSSILFRRGCMEEQGSNQDEQRKGARTGWGHNAADIAKELHVTRKFVYTVSVPLPSCNAYWCPAFHSTPMTRILKLYFLSTLKIQFYERMRRIARRHVVAKKLFRTKGDNFFASSGKPETVSLLLFWVTNCIFYLK